MNLAYETALRHFVSQGVNRVVVLTDGAANLGNVEPEALKLKVEAQRKKGLALDCFGIGWEGYNDDLLEVLASHGDGRYGFLNHPEEAATEFAGQLAGALRVAAADVKVQVEFNPAKVQAYRLIGYENRLLKKEDFNNDKIDAGDIGAGHTVTALYEVVPAGVEWKPDATVDPLKYQQPADSKLKTQNSKPSEDLLTVKLRYKAPDGDTSKLLEFPLIDQNAAYADASGDFKFAAAVAGFGMVLRDSPHKGAATLAEVLHWAEQGTDSDAGGYRGEFISLVKQAETILPSQG